MAEVKGHIIVLLAFLVLLGVIVSPVSAYTEVSTTSYDYSGTSNYYMDTFLVHNGSVFTGYGDFDPVSKITYSVNITTWGSDNTNYQHTGTTPFNVSDGTGWHNGTYTWTTSGNHENPSFALHNVEILFDRNDAYDAPGNWQIDLGTDPDIGNTGSMSGATTPSPVTEFGTTDYDFMNQHYQGNYQYEMLNVHIYTGSSVTAPVANFACDNVYSLPDADITCSDLSTNTPDYWRWSVGLSDTDESTWYTVDDVGDLFVWQSSDLGNYTVKLQVSNDAGSSWENKTDYVRIMMFPSWTATPTPAITVVPWTNITTLNASVYRAYFENTMIGNLSAPFLDLTEDIVGTVEAVILSFESVINWPFTLINEQVLGMSNIFGATFAGLLPYTVVPLAITGRVIDMIPWQILAIMTLGLLFDTMLLLLKGQ